MKITVHGREFNVLATFSGASRDADANVYMNRHPCSAVLAEIDGTVYLADISDTGSMSEREVRVAFDLEAG